MRKYKKVQKEVEVLEALVCDVCKKEYTDELETQEFHDISFQGGYDSVFGDSARCSIDICQHCFKKLLGEYVRILD